MYKTVAIQILVGNASITFTQELLSTHILLLFIVIRDDESQGWSRLLLYLVSKCLLVDSSSRHLLSLVLTILTLIMIRMGVDAFKMTFWDYSRLPFQEFDLIWNSQGWGRFGLFAAYLCCFLLDIPLDLPRKLRTASGIRKITRPLYRELSNWFYLALLFHGLSKFGHNPRLSGPVYISDWGLPSLTCGWSRARDIYTGQSVLNFLLFLLSLIFDRIKQLSLS